MSDQISTVAVQVPRPLFRRLQRIAKATHRSVEEVLATAVDVALPQTPDLPPDLASELAALNMFSDEALWAASESSLSLAQQRRLSQLTSAGGARSLTAAESAELAHLLELHDRAVLRRARALAVLTQRGYALPDRDDLPASTDAGR